MTLQLRWKVACRSQHDDVTQKSSLHTGCRLSRCKDMKSSYVCNIEIRCFRSDPLSWILMNSFKSSFLHMLSTNSKYSIHLDHPYIIFFCRKTCLLSISSRACNILHVFIVLLGRKVPRKKMLCCLFMWMHDAYLIHKHEKINLHLISASPWFVMGSVFEKQIAANSLHVFKNVVQAGIGVLNNLDNITSVINLYVE